MLAGDGVEASVLWDVVTALASGPRHCELVPLALRIVREVRDTAKAVSRAALHRAGMAPTDTKTILESSESSGLCKGAWIVARVERDAVVRAGRHLFASLRAQVCSTCHIRRWTAQTGATALAVGCVRLLHFAWAESGRVELYRAAAQVLHHHTA